MVSVSWRSNIQLFTPLFSRYGVPVVSLLPPTPQATPGVLHMLSPPSLLIEAAMQLSDRLNWTRMALVTESFQPYFVSATKSFLSATSLRNVTVSPYVELGTHSVEQVVTLIQRYAAKVVVLSLPLDMVGEILHLAYSNGMVWPEYGWIVHSFTSRELSASLHNALSEGVIFVNQKVSRTTEHCGKTVPAFSNAYAALLFDSIRLLSEAAAKGSASGTDTLTALSHISCEGASGRTGFDSVGLVDRDVWISQVRNGSEVLLAAYSNGTLAPDIPVLLGEVPSSDLPYVHFDTLPVWLSVLEISFNMLLITAVYIHFRKKPAIKATSTSLSLLIFLGCYVIVLYLILLTLQSYVHRTLGR